MVMTMKLAIPETDSQTSDAAGVTTAPLLYGLASAAKLLGVSKSAMARAVYDRRCDSVLLGRRRLISARQLATFVARLERGDVA